MTTKKKLIAIGVAASILTALFVWNPGGNISSLASRMLDDIPNPTVDHQIIPRLPNNVFGKTNADEYYHPRGVAVYENKLFVTDWYRHQIKVVNKNTGELIRTIGKNGSNNGDFKYPFNIVIDEKNKFFYVTDLNNDRVQKFNLETYAFVAKLGTTGSGAGNFTNPTGIAIDVANNRLYVSDYYCRVQRFELSTLQYRDSFGGSCGNKNDQFTRYNGYGPESIVVDWAGNVYVADTWNNRIQKFTYDGKFIKNIANYGTNGSADKDVSWPMGLFIDKGGYLYFTDTYRHRIKKMDLKAEGNPIVKVYGSNGNNNDQFQYPRGIFVDDNTDIYVADTNSHRIKVFQQHIIVPTAPTSLVATPNVTEMELTWTAASPRTGTPLLDYTVQYKKTADTDWKNFSDGIGTRTSATITGLTANTEYKFRVYARNTAREDGEMSTIITRSTLNALAPKAPTNLVTRIANRLINLSWTASNTNGGSAIKDYIVEYRLSSGGQWQIFNDGIRTATTADVTGLTNDVRYDFRVKAENSTGVGAFSPYSAVASRTPTADDKCNDIAGIQETVPKNLKRNTAGDCVCINEGARTTTTDPATCTLTCDARHTPVIPQFKVVYDEGYPKLYNNAQDTAGTPMTARKIIISDDADGTIWDTDTFIPLFRSNITPFYDGALLRDPIRLSLARNGNELKVLWYGDRNDDKIERVKGRIIIEGSPDIKWTSIVENNSVDDSDNVNIREDNNKIIRFDMVVNPANDSFVARYDLGSRDDACIEKPLIIFDKNAPDATGTMSDQVLTVGTAAALRANTFVRPGYTFAGWNTAADGGGTNYANSVSYTMTAARNVTLFAKWTLNSASCAGSIPANAYQLVGYTGGTYTTWTYDALDSGVHPACSFTCNAGYIYNSLNSTCTPNISIRSIGGDTTAPYSTTDTTPDIVVNTPTSTTQVTINGFTCIGVSSVLTQETRYTCTRTTAYTSGDQTVAINVTFLGGNRTINATFTVNTAATYAITYNPNGATGGTVPAAQTKIHDVALILGANSSALEKTGHTFAGWNTAANGTGTSYAAGANYTANAAVILYAKWTPNTYTITFDSQSATTAATPTTKTVVVPATNVGTLPTDPVKTGYTFGGWYTAINGGGTQFTATTTVTANDTVYAKWTAVAATYDITYNANGASSGSIPAAQVKTHGTALTLATNSGALAKTGYTFAGWNTTIDGTGTNYAAGASYTANVPVILYAKWTTDADTTAPTITTFTLPATSTSLTVTITTFTTSETTGVSYLLTESSTTPAANAAGWLITKPTSHTFGSAGSKTLYAWIKDTAGNVSNSVSGTVSVDTTAPATPTPIIPSQANITVSTTAQGTTYIATGSSMIINVACAAGERADVYQSGSATSLATANCINNLATLTLNLPTQEGTYTYVVTLTDTAGNVSQNSAIIRIFKQNTSNAPGIPDLDSLSDLGTSSTDNVTSEVQPRFTVSCVSGSVVNLYDGNSTSPVGASPCVASTAQILTAQPLSSGVHTLTAKQIISGTTSAASDALTLTIDTSPLNITLAKPSDQSDPSTSLTIRFTATFSRPIDVNSFICSDVTVTNGMCSSITLVSGNVYTITVISAAPGLVTVKVLPGRVQTNAGNLNTESTGYYTMGIMCTDSDNGKNIYTKGTTRGTNSNDDILTLDDACNGANRLLEYSCNAQYVTEDNIECPNGCNNGTCIATSTTTAECSDLRRFTTTNPRSSSLDDEDLCKKGNETSVSYSNSRREWTYQCRGNDGASVSCTVSAILESAPECEAQELPFDECSLDRTSNLYFFYEYLDCLGVAEQSSCNKSYGCPQEAKRQELVYIADQLRGIPLDEDNYECQGNHTDTERGVEDWVCEAAEKAQIAELISTTNTKFRPKDTMTRAEAYSVLMKSICVHPDTDYRNWQTKVAQEAKELGFTVRTVSTFEPNKLILRQELYALAARIAEYKDENGDECDDLPDELICEE